MNYSRLFHTIVVVGCAWAAPGCDGTSDPGPQNVTTGEIQSDGGTADLIDHSKHDLDGVIDGGWHTTK